MTSQQDQTDGEAGEMTRRSAMKMGALGASGLMLGLAGTGSAAAQESDQQNAQQDDDDLFVNEEQIDAAMYTGDFNPNGEFVITSDVIEWTPNVNENIQGVFDQFNTHMIKYQNSNRQAQLFSQRTPNSRPSIHSWATSSTTTRTTVRTSSPNRKCTRSGGTLSSSTTPINP